MKRDAKGKFVRNWDSEIKQRVSVSLTSHAWRRLDEEARKRGISRSEVIEHFARSLEAGVNSLELEPTETKQVAAALQNAEQKVANILESITDAFVAFDQNWHYTYVNRAAAQILQKKPQELIGKHVWHEVFPTEVEGLAYRELHRAVTQQVPVAWEEFRQSIQRWLEVNAYPFDEGVALYFRDITERKRLKTELCRQEQQFKILAENAPDIIARFDRNLRHVYVSPVIERHTGLPPSAFIGKNHAELGMPAEIHQLWQQRMRATFATQQACRFEFEFRTPDGTRYYQTQMVPEMGDDGTVESLMGITRDVTDYKRVEQALRQSEERYRSLVESLPQLVCMTDADGTVNYCNQSWIDYTGLTLEQTQGTGWQRAFHPDDLPQILARWTQAPENGNAYSIECRIKRWDGVYRWHLNRIVAIQSENNRPVAWLGTAIDIHDQKRTEQRERFLAQASKTFAAAKLDLQTLLDSITRLVSELTGDVCVLNLLCEDGVWLNHASCYHVDPEVQKFVRELLTRYPHRADEGMGGRVMQTGKPLLMTVTSQEELRAALKPEYQHYLTRFQVCSTLILPLKVRGQMIGVLSLTRHHPAEPHDQDDLRLFQDLADRAAMAIVNARLYQQAEQARQDAEQTADRNARLQAVTAILSELLTPAQVAEVIVEQSKAVLHATAATVAILNEQRTELEIVHSIGYQQDLTEAWRRFPITSSVALAEAVRTEQPIWEESLEARVARYPHLADIYGKYGYAAWISLPLMVEGRAIGGMSFSFAEFPALSKDDRAFMLALARQCAQAIIRAQLYEAQQRARTEAETANRVKDEFLAVLSHELRTPMNPILGWAKLLRTGKLDADKTATALETIERNAKLQTQLIEDLLDVSRILQGKMALKACPVNLVSTIEAAITTVQLAAQSKGIQIHTQLDSTVEPIFGDPSRLQQIVWNLLANAVKFTPSGGRVDVRLQSFKVDNLQGENLKNDLQPSTSYAQIQIQDTGKGINPEFLAYVFDYFRQADSTITRQFGGLGLGLAIVRHLVELHGGIVRAESPGEGQGATFTVYIPQANNLVKTLAHHRPSTTTDELKGLRVLVVDDEVDMRDLVDFILSEEGAKVTVVASAAEALLMLEQFQPDVLVSDIGMPEVDGYTLMRQVRARPPHQCGQIPAIALTAYAGEINQQQALAAGFQRHISKPVEPAELVQAIVTLVKR